jgi:hypothetical protein
MRLTTKEEAHLFQNAPGSPAPQPQTVSPMKVATIDAMADEIIHRDRQAAFKPCSAALTADI